MTSGTDDAPELMARTGLGSTYQHITLLKRKQEQLRERQIEAEEQFLHGLARAYRERALSELELANAYRAYADLAVPGFMKRWKAAIPVTVQRMQHILRYPETGDKHTPNTPDGTWRGWWPPGVVTSNDRVPGYGTCVVYVLYDAANEPCYVGSSKNLTARLKDHHKDGKVFAYWTAFGCADREAAYQLEERLLSEFTPYLNKKRSR